MSSNNKNNNNYIDGRITNSIKSVKNLFIAFTENGNMNNYVESIPLAKNTPVEELLTSVFPDKAGPPDKNGILKSPIAVISSYHYSRIGALNLSRKAKEFIDELGKKYELETLSVAAGIKNEALHLIFIVRIFRDENGNFPHPEFEEIFDYLGENKSAAPKVVSGLQGIKEEKHEEFSLTEIEDHKRKIEEQDYRLQTSSNKRPFLNTIEEYTPRDLAQSGNLPIYHLKDKQKASVSTFLPYDDFNKVFVSMMEYLTRIEQDSYVNAISAIPAIRQDVEEEFLTMAETNIYRLHVNDPNAAYRLPKEDVAALLKKLRRSLFELYIIQDLIDDPDISDIKITDPYSVRVRIKGKAYLSDVTFIDTADYMRFVDMLIIRNNLYSNIPSQTFTDTRDPNYILRFSITADYVTANGFPVLHIRKIARKKLNGDDLVRLGMFDEKIRKYLVDCGKYSRGVVFAGPPGSGKTVALNWFLDEAYEDTAEVLVIQENDELFSDKKGIIFEHVVSNPIGNMQRCTLEDLGQMALVSGANVFVIGESKGAEICSAITLSNSGCRTAMTVHSPSAEETIDKMADLAMRGYATDFYQAKRMIKSFQTIVYLQDFQVQEIKEIIGYDEERKDMIYRPIYVRGFDESKYEGIDEAYDLTGEDPFA